MKLEEMTWNSTIDKVTGSCSNNMFPIRQACDQDQSDSREVIPVATLSRTGKVLLQHVLLPHF